ncbi:methionine--tRNA ligase subunit beta [Candidatus Pacearchaeota archaeon ex4484_31]|nr:MAG: methionine--tRNA ligase subunit beta [Candidatus Pacearchaeota archaeon ex4484_31]
MIDSIKAIAILLWPFIPSASEKIAGWLGFKIKSLSQVKKPLKIRKIKKAQILFKKIKLEKKEKELAKEADKKMTVSFDEWKKLELKVGKIIDVKDHPNASKLYLLDIDLGNEKRTLVAGLKNYYKPEELKGKLCIVFTNLEPKTIRGIESKGMVLAAVNKEKDKVVLIEPEKEIEIGSRVE